MIFPEVEYDLHVHTIYSDGTFKPEEVVEKAKSKGLKGIAFTDHDNCDVFPFEDKELKIIPGIELSTKYKESDIEILGYFFDYRNSELQRAVDQSIYHRRIRIEEIVSFLQKDGIDISIEEVEKEAGGRVLVRPHIARVLIKKGYVKSLQEAFNKYLVSSKIEVLYKNYLSISEIIGVIHGAGGVAVLAHPYYYLSKIGVNGLQELLQLVLQKKIDGIEVFYPYKNVTNAKVEELYNWTKENKLLATGGSDFHGNNKKENELGIRGVAESTLIELEQRASCWR